MYFLFKQQSYRHMLIFILFWKISYVIIGIHMHICLVLTLIHHRRGRSKHTTVISFLLPRLINNSWVTIAGGASRGEGHPEILSLSRIPSKTGRRNQSLKPLCAEKKPITVLPSHLPTILAKGRPHSQSSSLTLQPLFRHSSVRR